MADEATPDPKVEASARDIGWVPKEAFRGDPERWVDAATFLKRGEELMPLLKANNKNLQNQVAQLTSKLHETSALVQAGQEAIVALRENQTAFTKAAVQRAKADIRTKLREAREANDMAMVGELEEQLDDLREAERDVKEVKAPPPPPPAPQKAVDPAFAVWQGENTWFGIDIRRTNYMLAEAQALRADPANNGLLGKAFYDKAAELADAVLNPRQTFSKTETGSGSGSGGGGGGGGGGGAKKTYRDLPSDAKAVCDRQAEMLVGAGRAFKTLAEWHQNYADQYFAE